MKASSLTIGIDIGGSKIAAALVHHQQLVSEIITVPTPRTYSALLKQLQALCTQLSATTKRSIVGIGMGVPGAVSKSGRVLTSNNTPLANKPLAQDLQKHMRLPTHVMNDANCFTLGEALMGAGQKQTSVLGIIIGTGCGAGWVMNQQPIVGRNHMLGEWVSWLSANGQPYEQMVAGDALLMRYQQHTRRSLPSISEFAARLKSGERKAEQVYDAWLDDVSRALAQMINMLDPDVVVVGGGNTRWPRFQQQLIRRVRTMVWPALVGTPIRVSKNAIQSAIIGAAHIIT